VTERRVVFDFEIEFANGGGIQGQDFRLDLPAGMGADGTIDPRFVAEAIVADLRLLMVSAVRVRDARVIEEPHKRSNPSGGLQPGSIVELSHVIRDGEVTYPGLPAPVIGAHLSREDSRSHYATGTEFHIGSISMVGNTGTYLDTPFHRYPDGWDLANLPATACVGLPGVVVRAPGVRAIGPELLADVDTWGRAVLFQTGRDVDFGTPAYGVAAPYLTAATAQRLIDGDARMVGIDAINIDDTRDGARPVHSALLAAGVPIVEHLTGLGSLPDRGFEVTALPPLVEGLGTFPVRVIARIAG
jgi:arylformamidase